MEGGTIMQEYTYQWKPENADDESAPILKITKSSLGTFKWCKRQYLHQYIERLPQDTSPAMLKGSIVHNSYEALWDDFDIIKAETMTEDELYSYFVSLFPIDDYGEVYDNMIDFEIQRFLQSKQEDTLSSYVPLENEIMLDAEILIPFDADPTHELKRSYIVHLQGIIDRVFQEGDICFPMELKTGLWKDTKLSPMRGEMAFYKLLMDLAEDENGERLFPPVEKWGWYYPESNYCYLEDVKGSSMTALKKRFARLIWAYENNDFAASFYYRTCQHCSFLGLCEAAGETGLEDW